MDLSSRPGEVVGLAGLLGSGRSELVRLLFGADRADVGELRVDGAPVALRSPRQAIGLGFGYTPENRKVDGVVPSLSVRENIVLALQGKHGTWRRLPVRQQEQVATRFVEALDIKTSGLEQPVGTLSGGNQQKVLLARWLATAPRLLILDEPTRGIDVGARAEIERLIGELGAEGMAVLMVSSELEEVVRVAASVVVLRDRVKVAELSRDQVEEGAILRAIARDVDAG
jgi:simple sugar transport system ATP-binding protein